MSIINIFKKEEEAAKTRTTAAKKTAVKKTTAKTLQETEAPVAAEENAAPKTPVKEPVVKGHNLVRSLLIKPLITEKSSYLAAENKYVFAVQKTASKSEVLKEVARVYNVHPVAVGILTVKGKYVQYGKTKGQTKTWKKAIVTLPQGEKIEFYHPNA